MTTVPSVKLPLQVWYSPFIGAQAMKLDVADEAEAFAAIGIMGKTHEFLRASGTADLSTPIFLVMMQEDGYWVDYNNYDAELSSWDEYVGEVYC